MWPVEQSECCGLCAIPYVQGVLIFHPVPLPIYIVYWDPAVELRNTIAQRQSSVRSCHTPLQHMHRLLPRTLAPIGVVAHTQACTGFWLHSPVGPPGPAAGRSKVECMHPPPDRCPPVQLRKMYSCSKPLGTLQVLT